MGLDYCPDCGAIVTESLVEIDGKCYHPSCGQRVYERRIVELEAHNRGLNLLKNEHFDMCEKLKKQIAERDTKIKDALQNMRLAKEAMYQRMTGRDNPLSARITALEECMQRLR